MILCSGNGVVDKSYQESPTASPCQQHGPIRLILGRKMHQVIFINFHFVPLRRDECNGKEAEVHKDKRNAHPITKSKVVVERGGQDNDSCHDEGNAEHEGHARQQKGG